MGDDLLERSETVIDLLLTGWDRERWNNSCSEEEYQARRDFASNVLADLHRLRETHER